MKSSTVWHGHSTRPSLPAGTARKDSGHLSGRRPLHLANARPFGRSKAPLGLLLLRKRELAYGRRNRLITPPVKKNRAFPTGNALLYISLSYVDFSGCVRRGRTLFFCYTPDVPSRISHRRNCVNLTQFLPTAARTPHAYFKSNRFSDTPASAQERFSVLWASWQCPPTPAGYAPIRHLSYQWYWPGYPTKAEYYCPWSWVFRPAHGL